MLLVAQTQRQQWGPAGTSRLAAAASCFLPHAVRRPAASASCCCVHSADSAALLLCCLLLDDHPNERGTEVGVSVGGWQIMPHPRDDVTGSITSYIYIVRLHCTSPTPRTS
jgi:hypothetical protein